ncbi:MAG: NUDIX domain-containing protein [Candidatus Lokiarchaeota archaeon]|nr:NUDIX domain-containing protein [Candidatus Lokiarchaeota archaeon]
MEKNIDFFYNEEFWFISAFINSNKCDRDEIAKRIEKIVKERVSKISEKDAYLTQLAKNLVDMAQNISIVCNWVDYISIFPYYKENTDKFYDVLGYFEFQIEYYKNNPEKKKTIKPLLIQQIPHIILRELKDKAQFMTEEVLIDLESPIYIFATSDKTDPPNIKWDEEAIETYKKDLSYWTVLYSGQWEDYSPSLYENRIQNNLSNRLSELHFINRNNGFVYMAEDNYKNFFEPYMKPYVVTPAAQIRTIIFCLREINGSLDILFLNTYSEGRIDTEKLEEKINNLRFLRGILQNALSIIYNELDYNRRQHYTSVLTHLIDKFELDNIKGRMNQKFDLLYNTMNEIHQKRVQEDQEETEKALNILNFLLGAGILADLVELAMIALSLNAEDFQAILLNSVVAIIISSILIMAVIYYMFVKFKVKRGAIKNTVDAVILNEEGDKIVLVKRRFPPFQNHYALPGGYIQKKESLEHAVKREVKEETNLDVSIIKKIGYYDDPNRDPRGKVHSTAYLCKIKDGDYQLKGKTDALSAEFIPTEELEKIPLAFDHREILKDADLIEKDSIFDIF